MSPKVTKSVWVGRVVSGLVPLMFLMSAAMKIKGGPEVEQGMAHLGIPETMLLPLAVLELTCIAIYLVPATSVLGAILMAGYIGGAMLAHWRVGDPFYLHVGLGLLLWLGVYLREPRLRDLIPLRKP